LGTRPKNDKRPIVKGDKKWKLQKQD
jgi:hypothetical protein